MILYFNQSQQTQKQFSIQNKEHCFHHVRSSSYID
jgi:hypothetical protein